MRKIQVSGIGNTDRHCLVNENVTAFLQRIENGGKIIHADHSIEARSASIKGPLQPNGGILELMSHLCHCAAGWICGTHPDSPEGHYGCTGVGVVCTERNATCPFWRGDHPLALDARRKFDEALATDRTQGPTEES